MLTRKVYNKLAQVIKEIPDKSIRNKISKEFAEVLKENNTRFDYVKWFNACDVD